MKTWNDLLFFVGVALVLAGLGSLSPALLAIVTGLWAIYVAASREEQPFSPKDNE